MTELLIRSGKLLGKKIVLPAHEVLVGRDEGCQIRLASGDISRRHCALRPSAEGLMVRDLGSQNGTFVNEAPISGEVLLTPGDRLRVGPIEFQIPGPKPGAKRPALRSAMAAAEAAPPESASDDDIAAWLTEETIHEAPIAAGDTTIIQGRPQPKPPAPAPEPEPPRPAPASAENQQAGPDRKRFKTVADEAADIIRRHWAAARTQEQAEP